MIITERRIVEQYWYTDEYTVRGWDSHGWTFRDGGSEVEKEGWTIVEHLQVDKFGNAWTGIAEKETKIEQ